MYARFTDRARYAMQLANKEARRFNHEYIGTEHMLLGLIKEGSGGLIRKPSVALRILNKLGVSPEAVRLETERILEIGTEAVGSRGRRPATPQANRAIEHAVEEARGLRHNWVGTEHLLLGLLSDQEGVAAQVVMNFGLKLDVVREEVRVLLTGSP